MTGVITTWTFNSQVIFWGSSLRTSMNEVFRGSTGVGLEFHWRWPRPDICAVVFSMWDENSPWYFISSMFRNSVSAFLIFVLLLMSVTHFILMEIEGERGLMASPLRAPGPPSDNVFHSSHGGTEEFRLWSAVVCWISVSAVLCWNHVSCVHSKKQAQEDFNFPSCKG